MKKVDTKVTAEEADTGTAAANEEKGQKRPRTPCRSKWRRKMQPRSFRQKAFAN